MISNALVGQGLNKVIEASSGKTFANLCLFLCNFDLEMGEVVDIHVVKSGESPSPSNVIIAQLYICPTHTFTLEEKFFLESGDSIWVAAQVGGRVSATMTYTDV